MNNKFNESKHANHIGFVLSEIIMTIGGALLLFAIIEMVSNDNYTFEPSYTIYETQVLMMMKYGLALAIGGIFSCIVCSHNIYKIETQNDQPAKKPSEHSPLLEENIEDMDLADINEFVDKESKNQNGEK